MDMWDAGSRLFEKGFITAPQNGQIQLHKELKLFSMRTELLALLFIGITLFCSGAGIVIYQHIDSVGHIILLTLLLGLTIFCFYYSFRHAPAYTHAQVTSERPLYDHLLLAANLLAGSFILYLQ